MTHAVTGFRLAICLAIFSAAAAFSQTTDDDEATSNRAAAHIYLQVAKGVDVYSVTAEGKLTLVKGSPFPVIGQMEDVNGKYLISVGKRLLHSYPIESSGAVGKHEGVIDTQAFGGSQCGLPDGTGSVLDHTGKYLYLSLYLPAQQGDGGCAVWQTYDIERNGQFKYLGYVESFGDRQGYAEPDGLPTVSSNDKFAYATQPQFEDGNYRSFTAFKIASNGELVGFPEFESLNPQTPDGSWFYYPTAVAADNAGHLAAVLNWFVNGGAPQLASYTIESNGNIKSTNAWADMPAVSYSAAISMSLSGKLLAVNQGPGLQIFHFNGSAPITQFSSLLLPTVNISQMAWDTNNHLYVVAGYPQVMYVYTVTSTSISEVAGSPFKLASGSGNMILVPKMLRHIREELDREGPDGVSNDD